MKSMTLAFLLIFSFYMKAQDQKSTAGVKGNCNGTAIGTNITVTVRCEDGLSAAQSKALATQYAEILHKIRQDSVNQKLNFDDMLERLKAIQDGITDIRAVARGRRLTPSQINALAAFAHATPLPPDIFNFNYYGSDLESKTYASDFMVALGIDPLKTSFTVMSSVPTSGIEFRISASDYAVRAPLPEVCVGLLRMLDEEHIAITKISSPNVIAGHCELMIGYKPTS